MRDIKFRGKRIDNGQWIYGGISIFNGDTTIFDENSIGNGAYEVDPKTVGQYTERDDKDGNEIWEHDVDTAGNVVEFVYGSWCLNGDRPLHGMASKIKIVTNIHDRNNAG